MQFYSNPRSIQASKPEKCVPCVTRAQEQGFKPTRIKGLKKFRCSSDKAYSFPS